MPPEPQLLEKMRMKKIQARSLKEKEPSADKDVEESGGIGEMDQSIEYIVHFAKVIELYQKKSRNCFEYGSP